MKESLKRILPPIVTEQIPILKTYIKYMTNKDYFTSNSRFKNCESGKDLVIVGNGPSLKKVDLKKLNHMDMFVVNDFYVHEDFNELNIKYYFNMDPREIWFENIVKSVPNDKLNNIEFFLSFSHIERIKKMGDVLKNKNYIIHGGSTYQNYEKYLDIHRPTLGIINILQILLVTVHYMGYKNIYLVGFDYSFLAYKNKNQIPHFHNTDNRAYKPEIEENSYTRVTCNACKLFLSLQELVKVLDKKINIFNATHEDSYLDIFREIGLERLYE